MAKIFKRLATDESSQLAESLQAQLAELQIQDQNDELQALIEETKRTNEMAKECRDKVREFFMTTENVRAKLATITPQVKQIADLIREAQNMRVSGKDVKADETIAAGVNVIMTAWNAIIGDGETGGEAYLALLKILSVIYKKELADLEKLPPTALFQMGKTIFSNPMFMVFFPQLSRSMSRM